jgi:hypothetical protein
LLPDGLKTNAFAYKTSLVSVAKLKLKKLKEVLKRDNSIMIKFWQALSYRYVILNDLAEFKGLSNESIISFCQICTLKMYMAGDTFSTTDGGILLKGSIVYSVEQKDKS